MRGYTISDIAAVEGNIKEKSRRDFKCEGEGGSSVLATVPGSRGSDAVFHGKWPIIFVAGQVTQKK